LTWSVRLSKEEAELNWIDLRFAAGERIPTKLDNSEGTVNSSSRKGPFTCLLGYAAR
jgi:hypothetical protein